MMLSRGASSPQESQAITCFEMFEDHMYAALDRFVLSVGRSVECARDEIIFHEGDLCSRFYRVVEGTVRMCRFRHDGSRQIEAFYLPGDYFGFDIGREARFTAEATTNTALLAVDATSPRDYGDRSRIVNSAIWKLALDELHRSQNHALVLGYRHAHDRVLAFLEEITARLHRVSSIDLPMSRQDIADYLGLTIETVSRSFTDLSREGVIGMPRPRTVILKKAMRAQVAGSSCGNSMMVRSSDKFSSIPAN